MNDNLEAGIKTAMSEMRRNDLVGYHIVMMYETGEMAHGANVDSRASPDANLTLMLYYVEAWAEALDMDFNDMLVLLGKSYSQLMAMVEGETGVEAVEIDDDEEEDEE